MRLMLLLLLLLLLLFCRRTFTEKHTLSVLLTVWSGVRPLPQVVSVAQVDGVEVLYCDSDAQGAEPRRDWMKQLTALDPQHLHAYTQECVRQQRLVRAQLSQVMQHLGHTHGVHVLQSRGGCEWDDETAAVKPFRVYAYDGEDFLRLEVESGRWASLTPEAEAIKDDWDKDTDNNQLWNNHHTSICPQWLKKYLEYGNSSLHRPGVGSVFLLQKSPLAPVTCHVSGFHPDRAVMFWRKDGGEGHEEAEPGEILPNADGTYQMSVDLDISSVAAEQWKRYECVFQLRRANETTIKLDQALIRTNWNILSEFPIAPLVGCMVGFLLLAIIVAGVIRYRMNHKSVYPM